MIQLFHILLYKPIFNIFVGLYNLIPGHDVGVVILIITILVRILLYPLTNSSIKAQRSLQELQPKMNEIKKKYKDKQKQTQAIMQLYKGNKVNPFASCLPMLVQLPILIALYMVLRDALTSTNLAENLYSYISNPGQINAFSLGMFDMAKRSVVLAVLAGAAQYWQAKTMSRKQPPKQAGSGAKDENMMAMMNKQMLYFMPVLTVFIGMSLPAGLTLYWFCSTLLMALQQVWLNRKPIAQTNSSGVIEGEVVDDKK